MQSSLNPRRTIAAGLLLAGKLFSIRSRCRNCLTNTTMMSPRGSAAPRKRHLHARPIGVEPFRCSTATALPRWEVATFPEDELGDRTTRSITRESTQKQ